MSNIDGRGFAGRPNSAPQGNAQKTTSDHRLNEILRGKVEELFGERGDPNNHAVRQKDLTGLNNALGGLLKTTGSLASSIGGAQAGLGTLGDRLVALGNLINSLQSQVTALQAAQTTDESNISTLQAEMVDIQGKVDAAHAVTVPGMTAAHAAGTVPTKAEFDALVDDMTAIRSAVVAIAAAL